MTGFEPFLSYSHNPSGEIAKRLSGEIKSRSRVIGVVQPVKHMEAREHLNQYIKKFKPSAIIGTALAAKRGCILLEKVALNYFYYTNEQKKADELLHKDGPAAYFSKLPLTEIKKALQGSGIPAELSFWPDTFVSNEVFYEIMRSAEKLKIKHAGFVHLPLTHRQVIDMDKMHYLTRAEIPSMDESTIENAVRIVIKTTLGRN